MVIIKDLLKIFTLIFVILLLGNGLAAAGGISSIKEVTIDLDGDFVPDQMKEFLTVRGIVTSPNFNISKKLNYIIQDSTGAITIYSTTFGKTLHLGDMVQVSGAVWQFKGKTELVIPDSSYITVLTKGNLLPEPQLLTIPESGENYENHLILLENVQLVNAAAWPIEGYDANVEISDGIHSIIMRIDKNTELDGWIPPEGKFSVNGVLDQFATSETQNDNYQIKPRFKSDIKTLSSQ